MDASSPDNASRDDYMTAMPTEKPKSLSPTLMLAGVLGAILAVAVVMAVDVWSGAGDTGMSVHGYIAMGLGAVVTLLLGGGLMALAFFSSRRGYDDAAGARDEFDERE
jgi:hypothetical protein